MPTLARRSCSRWTFAACAVALALAGLIAAHVEPFNGPSYYPWTFASMPARESIAMATLIAAHVALIWLALARVRSMWLAVALMAVGSLALRVGLSAIPSNPPGLADAAALVRDSHVGSFFTAAEMGRTARWTLADYPALMPQFPLHAQNKPPASMLFWTALLDRFDAGMAARVGVVIVAAISACAVPLAAAFARSLRVGDNAARHVAGITSLLPGAVLFFPLFDPAFTTWSLLLLTTWFAAVRGPAWRAAAFGALLAATLFVVLNVLPIGLYLFVAGLLVARDAVPHGNWIGRFLQRSIVAIVAALVGLLAMRVVLGYDALATVRVAIDQQAELMRAFGDRFRPYPLTIGWDLYDAALGVGFAPAILAVAAALARGRVGRFALCGLGTWLVVAIAGLLPGETARVWAFLFPLVALPAGVVVSRASRRARLAFYATAGVVLFAFATRLIFVAQAPVITPT